MTLLPKRITTLLVAFGMLSLGGATAIAKPAKQGADISANNSQKRVNKRAKRNAKRQKRIATFDTNRNGKLDKPERQQMKRQRFTQLDSNQDGGVTLQEMRTLRQQKRTAKLATLPAEKKARRQARASKRSARMSKRNARMSKRFAKRDADSNGSITWGEFSKAKQGKRGQKRRRGFGRRGQKQRGGQQG